MDYAARLPRQSPRSLVVPVVALVIGAGAATGVYALIDNGNDVAQGASKVVVVETPAQQSAAEAIRMDPHGPAIIHNTAQAKGH